MSTQGLMQRFVRRVSATSGRACLYLLAVALILSPLNLPTTASAQTEDIHVPRRMAQNVSQLSTAGKVFYWSEQPQSCNSGPVATAIARKRTTDWETRTVFSRTPAPDEPCPYVIYSNIVADASYLYWVDASGLVRFSVDANLYSSPETILAVFAGVPSELASDAVNVYGYSGGHLWYLEKANPARNFSIGFTGPETARNLQWDGSNLYMIWGTNQNLVRYSLDGSRSTIATGVSTYVPIGRELVCDAFACTNHQYVYYVLSNQADRVLRHDLDGSHTPVYTSTVPPDQRAKIYALAAAPSIPILPGYTNVFFWEKRWTPCACLVTPSRDWLGRLNGGAEPAELVYYRDVDTSWHAGQFTTGDNYLWWKDIRTPNANHYGSAYRYAVNATAFQSINMRVTGMEITQGVQRPDNSVFLVRNRPTFVRLFVKSDGNDVPNVTARLTAIWDGLDQDTIQPMTALLTVRNYPGADLAKNFLFALPLEWTRHNDLRLKVTLNPFGHPLEPNYADNVITYGPFSFGFNPRANFHISRVSYNWQGVNYTANDADAIVSWLYRAYPLGIDPGQQLPWITILDIPDLGGRVRNFENDRECQGLLKKDGNGMVISDDRNLCASYYLHTVMAALRRQGNYPNNAYIYASVVGMARGSASPSAPVSNGQSWLAAGWPFEVSGFYAGHELGHLLGRGHPTTMADDPKTSATEGCGHSPADANFPYFGGNLGDGTSKTTGFDSRWNVLGGQPKLYHWYDKTRDVMTYCNAPNQWLSDYTYGGIYWSLLLHPTPPGTAGAGPGSQGLIRPQAGDFLNVGGFVAADGSTTSFNYLSRVDSMLDAALPAPGEFSLRFLSANGSVLASYPFSPEVQDESPEWLTIAEAVPFAAGTRQVQVVSNTSGAVLGARAVSPNPPVVSNVNLAGAVEPLLGSVTLNWTASDLDGDPMSFDTLYSADNGATFQILQIGITGTTTVMDTAALPGDNLILRVRASDGVNTAYVDSPPVQVAGKAPSPLILTPTGGSHSEYGQAIELTGYALDPQDGAITSLDGLTWSVGSVGGESDVIGFGPTVTLRDLAVGVNVIRLTATNSLGLTAFTDLTLTVGDDLSDPPPALAVTPAYVSWQVESGTSAPQSEQVQIENGGGPGELRWTASVGAGWVSLDTLSGSVPYTLTLTAPTAGLAANTSLTATLTITAEHANGTQTVRIPVLLQTGAGAIWQPPPPVDTRYIYLPLIRR